MKEKTAAAVTLRGDHLVRATACEGHVRAFALRAESTVNQLLRYHDLSPMVTRAAGKLAMATQLLAADLKNKNDSLTLILRCRGEMEGMTLVSDAASRVRGLVRVPQLPSEIEGHPLTEAEAIGEGELTVIKDLGLREPYIGTTPLLSGNLAEDVGSYLWQSEQIPSAIFLSVKLAPEGVTQAGALMVQLLPDATEADLDYIEKRAKGGFPEISFLLEEGFSPAQILDLFFGREDLCYLESEPISYFCPCSQERMEKNLLTLGRSDLEELAEDPAGITLECHFCGKKYPFRQEEVRELLEGRG